MNIFLELLKIIWFLLPAGVANMAAGVSGKLMPNFNSPLDLNLKIRNKRIFGDHKTVRGVLFGVVFGLITYLLQLYLIPKDPFFQTISIFNYQSKIILGLIFPLGALLGDATKSFFKRQLSIPPGKPWFPFDQIDWLLGSLLFSYFFIKFSLVFALSVIVVGLILHLLTKILGFFLNFQEEKF